MSARKDLVFCEHCQLFVARRTFRQHKQRYYNDITNTWNGPLIAKMETTSASYEMSDSNPESCDPEYDISVEDNSDTSQQHHRYRKMDEFCEFFQATSPESMISDLINDTEKSIREKWDMSEENFTQDFLNKPLSEQEKHLDDSVALIHWITVFIAAWSAAFNISRRCLEAILFLLKVIFQACSKISPSFISFVAMLPSTSYQLHSMTKTMNDPFTKLVVCPKCHKVYQYDDCVEIVAGHKKSKQCEYVQFPEHRQRKQRERCGAFLLKEVILKNGKHVLTPIKIYCWQPIQLTLKKFLETPYFADKCEEWRSRDYIPGTYRDIYDGKIWKEFQTYNGRPFLEVSGRYALMMNVDWFQPFKHSPYSVGVIYFTVMNLPRDIRFKKENLILAGIIPGNSEPDGLELQFYLQPIVDELKELWQTGFQHTPHGEKHPRQFYVALLCIACDVPATRKVCGFLNHNARLGCSKCVKEFDTENFGDRADYGGFEPQPARKYSDMKKHVTTIQQENTATGKKGLQSRYGVRYSALMELDYIDLVRFHIIDPMHNLFLGTAKRILKSTWAENHDLKLHFNKIQQHVNATVVPSEIGNIPYKIASCFGKFNSEELKNWTMYYSPFSVKPYLPDQAFKCWMLFFEACHKLCQPMVNLQDLVSGHNNLMNFCRTFEELYGREWVQPNMHFHTHILDCILDYGPVYSFWLFSFERYNGILSRYHTNQRGVEVQLFRRFTTNMALCELSNPSNCFDEFFLPLFKSVFDAHKMPIEQIYLADRKELVYLALGPTKVGLEHYQIPSVVELLSQRCDGLLDESELDSLNEALSKISGNYDEEIMSVAYNEYASMKVLGVHFGSLGSTSERSSYIRAAWCDAQGTINTSGQEFRPGQILYILTMYIQNKVTNELKPVVFAKVRWYQAHPRKNFYETPSVSVWCHDIYEPEGPASFIPVHRIRGKVISGFTKINNEHVRVIIPQASRLYW